MKKFTTLWTMLMFPALADAHTQRNRVNNMIAEQEALDDEDDIEEALAIKEDKAREKRLKKYENSLENLPAAVLLAGATGLGAKSILDQRKKLESAFEKILYVQGELNKKYTSENMQKMLEDFKKENVNLNPKTSNISQEVLDNAKKYTFENIEQSKEFVEETAKEALEELKIQDFLEAPTGWWAKFKHFIKGGLPNKQHKEFLTSFNKNKDDLAKILFDNKDTAIELLKNGLL